MMINNQPYKKLVREFINNQTKSLDELNELNWIKRKQLLEYAFNSIPYYHDRFLKAGIDENDINSPEVWPKIPILTKNDLVENFNLLCKPELIDGCFRVSSTGGSTGMPTKVIHDLSFQHTVLGDRMLSWWKISPQSNIGKIWRIRGHSKRESSKWKLFIKRIIPGLTQKVITLDASFMDHQSMNNFIDQWNKICPPLLSGYVGGVYHIADYILRNNITVHSPKAVWVTAAPVLKIQRTLIEKAFNAPVYDQYGTCEIYWLAAECTKHNGLHMFYDARHIEFVDEANTICKPGNYGRILVTDLYNRAFPLIRYEIGDIGRQLDINCNCGINLPLMDAVKGRITDVIRLRDGTAISGEYLTTIFDDYPDAIKAFQIYQRSDFSIEIKIVPVLEDKEIMKVTQIVENRLRDKIKNSISIETHVVSEIKSDRGKMNYVISDIK